MFGWFRKKAPIENISSLASAKNINLQDIIDDLLRGHGLSVSSHEGWAIVNNDLPGLRGAYELRPRESGVMLQMDIELRLGSGRSIWEHYAGWGDSEKQAVGEAVYKFCAGAFHVYLSAYWNHHEPDQVEIERWTIGDTQWDAYVGNMIQNASEGQKSGFPRDYMTLVQQAISSETFSREDHWFSFYGANLKGDLTMDSRLDNDSWQAVNEKLASLEWPEATGFYSTRNFILLRPAGDKQ